MPVSNYTPLVPLVEQREERESCDIFYQLEGVCVGGVGRTLIQNISLSRPVRPSSVNSLGTTEEESTRKADETIEKGTSAAGVGWHGLRRRDRGV